jgi:SAM-dependent methyltransferase
VAVFRVRQDDDDGDTPSRRRGREALSEGGSVLDVGCGGGRASLAVVPPGGLVVGVDPRSEMLHEFARAAEARALRHREVPGRWPEVASATPPADVVVCHHVAYNVADLAAFALALDTHAVRRVVLELTQRHPLAYLSPLWERFWGLTRPPGPTAQDALEVLREAGLPARLELWEDPTPSREACLSTAERVEIVRIRLCLTSDRDPEIADALRQLPPRVPRASATIWWDR